MRDSSLLLEIDQLRTCRASNAFLILHRVRNAHANVFSYTTDLVSRHSCVRGLEQSNWEVYLKCRRFNDLEMTDHHNTP